MLTRLVTQPSLPSADGSSSSAPASSALTRQTWSGRLPASTPTKRLSTALLSASGARSFKSLASAGSRAATTPGGEAFLARTSVSVSQNKSMERNEEMLNLAFGYHLVFFDRVATNFLSSFLLTIFGSDDVMCVCIVLDVYKGVNRP